MLKRFLTIIILAIYALIISCREKPVVEDPAREVYPWNPPIDFRPSYITQDADSLYWGLFISKRFSGKFNLWAVKSKDHRKWTDPVLIDNAYFCRNIDFTVRNDSLHFVFYEIDPAYFPDHGLGLGDFVDNKDEMEKSFLISDLTLDRDLDNLPDNAEKEFLTSDRLSDSDLDGKPDNYDFCPMARPRPQTEDHKVYEAALWEIIRSSGLDTIKVQKDTAWSNYFRIYVLDEPNPLYLAFPRESKTFEMSGFPFPLVTVKTPLWYGSRQTYHSLSDEIIPHLNFKAIRYNFLKNQANVYLENYSSPEVNGNYEIRLKKSDDAWRVTGIFLIEDEKPDEDTTSTDTESDSANSL